MCDTKLDEKEGFKLVETKVKEAMLICPEGYDGFLYVGRYGYRFTSEDMKVFEFLTKIFGPDFTKQMFILVLTAGDYFEDDHAEDGLTFEDWCRNERGYFRDVKRECGNKIMLFNNWTKDEADKTKQFDKVLSFIMAIDKKYTDENFERAMLLKGDENCKQEQILTKVSLLLDKLQEKKGKYSQDKLLELSEECSRVLLFIQRQDQHASFSRQIREKLEGLKESVDRGYSLYIHNQENINENQESAINQIRGIEKEIKFSIHELHLSYKEIKQNYRVNIFHLVGFALVCVFTGVAVAAAVGGAVALAGAGGVAAVAGSAGGTAGVAAGVDAAVAAGSAVIAGSVGGAVGSATSAFAGRFLHQNINNQ